MSQLRPALLVRANRKGLTKAVVVAKLTKGQITAKVNSSGIVVMKWRYKRDVHILLTRHGDAMVDICKQNWRNEDVQKPQAVVYYNKFKQGIDISDQMSSYHTRV